MRCDGCTRWLVAKLLVKVFVVWKAVGVVMGVGVRVRAEAETPGIRQSKRIQLPSLFVFPFFFFFFFFRKK